MGSSPAVVSDPHPEATYGADARMGPPRGVGLRLPRMPRGHTRERPSRGAAPSGFPPCPRLTASFRDAPRHAAIAPTSEKSARVCPSVQPARRRTTVRKGCVPAKDMLLYGHGPYGHEEAHDMTTVLYARVSTSEQTID